MFDLSKFLKNIAFGYSMLIVGAVGFILIALAWCLVGLVGYLFCNHPAVAFPVWFTLAAVYIGYTWS